MILVLNSGSTSLKFKLFDKKLNQIYFGLIEKIGQDHSIVDLNGIKSNQRIISHKEALDLVYNFLDANLKENIDTIIHRIVHGGVEFTKPTMLSLSVISKISKYNDLAPLHNPVNLQVAKLSLNIWKKARHIGMFDTMFFSNLEKHVFTYPISGKYLSKYSEIRKYGFHGFSHQGMLFEASLRLNKNKNNCNLITCHLGGGASITAIKSGMAVDTSLGFSPLSGLMMMTRCGDIDASIVKYLVSKGNDIDSIFSELNFNSGIKGISQISDLRDVMILNGYKIPGYKSNIKANKENKWASSLALKMFIYRTQRYISSYMTLLDSVDAIVFSGGIGERNSDIRNLIMNNRYFKKIKVIVVPCDEEKNMALSLKK